MKKFLFILTVLLCISMTGFALSAETSMNSSYEVGSMAPGASDGISGFDRISAAFQNAFDNFGEYRGQPSSAVTVDGDYYSQTFSDAERRGAGIFVGPDLTAYTVGYPLFDQLTALGGTTVVGYPTSSGYYNNGNYYQNFTNGYLIMAEKDSTARFVEGRQIDENGMESDLNSGSNTNTDTDTDTDWSSSPMTDPGDPSISDITRPGTENPTDETSTKPSMSRAGAIGTAVAVVVLVALIILVIAMARKKRRD